MEISRNPTILFTMWFILIPSNQPSNVTCRIAYRTCYLLRTDT